MTHPTHHYQLRIQDEVRTLNAEQLKAIRKFIAIVEREPLTTFDGGADFTVNFNRGNENAESQNLPDESG